MEAMTSETLETFVQALREEGDLVHVQAVGGGDECCEFAVRRAGRSTQA